MLDVQNGFLQEILAHYRVYDTIDLSQVLLNLVGDVTEQDKEEIKLIYKVSFNSRLPIVIKFRGGCTERNRQEIIEQQSQFADILRGNGIPTPKYYKADGAFTKKIEIEGYRLTVTVEDFAENEVKAVNEEIAYKTGAVLANTHNISEENDCHVSNKVLFNPFSENDLFFYADFEEIGTELPEELLDTYNSVCTAYYGKMDFLKPLKSRKAFAVQGDMSDCNTYLTPDGDVGVFDYNCCGDNILFCDAVMQGWFVAHNMEYSEPLTEEFSRRIFTSFLSGYYRNRKFSQEEKTMIPVLYSVIDAFGSAGWSENEAFKNNVKIKAVPAISEYMENIQRRLKNVIDVQFLN